MTIATSIQSLLSFFLGKGSHTETENFREEDDMRGKLIATKVRAKARKPQYDASKPHVWF